MTERAPFELVEPSEELLQDYTDAAYIVEGDAFAVWSTYAKESSIGYKRIKWKQAYIGDISEVARFAGYPIVISMSTHHLNGVPVLFYEATSLVVHHGAIREWFDKHFPDVPRTDAMNIMNKQLEAERVRGISG